MCDGHRLSIDISSITNALYGPDVSGVNGELPIRNAIQHRASGSKDAHQPVSDN